VSEHHRVAVVGSGFAGLGTAIRLKQEGISDFVVFERSGDVGGTWHDNTYPGCACDVPSHLYSFSFALNPDWSRAFSPQPEIWAYLRRCAEDHGLLPQIRFDTPVTAMRFDEKEGRWLIETPSGDVTADFVVAAGGGLSEPLVPELPGLESFGGTTFHSATWDHSCELSGKRVAVVGTGASSIQFVPQIQPLVSKLVLFQRTAPWLLPRRDRAFGRLERFVYRHLPFVQRLARAAIYWGRETYVLGFTGGRRLMRLAQRASIAHMHRQVKDPVLREKLTPRYEMGCKRILIASDYYPVLENENVEVVTEAVTEVRPGSVVAGDGTEYEVDAIIFGTGFHVTDFPAAAHIFGRDGVSLEDAWAVDGMQAYKGTAVAGFPNLFLVTGPNTGLGHTSMVFMIESQVAYVLDCIRYLSERALVSFEVRPDAQAAFNDELARRLEGTVWNAGGCRSWYLDAKGRNTTLWPGFTWEFRRRTRHFDPDAYVFSSRKPESVSVSEGPVPNLLSRPVSEPPEVPYRGTGQAADTLAGAAAGPPAVLVGTESTTDD